MMKTTIFTVLAIALCTMAIGQTNVNETRNKTLSGKDKGKPIANATKEANKKHYEKEIKEKNEELTQLNKELEQAIGDREAMDKIEEKIKSKEAHLTKIEKERDVRLALFEGNYKALFPTFNELYRQQFFQSMYNKGNDKTSFVNSFSLAVNNDGALAQSEVVTDNLGIFRIAFGSMVTSSSETPTDETEIQEETEQDAVKRLINGGGNFYLEILLPLITTNNENEGWVTWYTYANVIGASDIKGFGNNLDTSTANASGGLTTYAGVTSDNGKFNFFVQANLNYTMGSDDFYKNLGLTEEKGFLNGKFVAGITMLNTFRLSAIVSTFGSDEKLRNGNVTFGVQILPKL